MPGRGRMALVVGTVGAMALGAAACGVGAGRRASVAGPQGPETVAAPRAGPDLAAGGSVEALRLPPLEQRIIKTARLGLQVRRGTFDERVQEAAMIAAGHAGYVSSSDTATGRLRSGTLVLRVPATQFESALGELRSMGTVKSQKISGQDVTAQFVDLQARLRNWQAQEGVLLRLMQRSTSIGDSLRVQNELQDVQLQIEEIQGQLRALNDQTAFSSITAVLTEARAVAPPPSGRSFAGAWSRAVHGLAVMGSGLIVASGYLAPFALLGLAGLLAWGAFRRLRPRATSRA